jgi:hypothetical protein
MDSIIEDCNSYHISLLKVILILIGKDIDLTKNYKIIELNEIFNNLTDDDFKASNIPNKIIDDDINNDDDDEEDNDEEEEDEENDDDEEEEVK